MHADEGSGHGGQGVVRAVDARAELIDVLREAWHLVDRLKRLHPSNPLHRQHADALAKEARVVSDRLARSIEALGG